MGLRYRLMPEEMNEKQLLQSLDLSHDAKVPLFEARYFGGGPLLFLVFFRYNWACEYCIVKQIFLFLNTN